MTSKVALSAAARAAALALASPAGAVDKVKFQLSWRPQAEHGCFYQAVGAGIYAKHGLEVTIQAGGPQINLGAVQRLP